MACQSDGFSGVARDPIQPACLVQLDAPTPDAVPSVFPPDELVRHRNRSGGFVGSGLLGYLPEQAKQLVSYPLGQVTGFRALLFPVFDISLAVLPGVSKSVLCPIVGFIVAVPLGLVPWGDRFISCEVGRCFL